jgi:hypothetical protein
VHFPSAQSPSDVEEAARSFSDASSAALLRPPKYTAGHGSIVSGSNSGSAGLAIEAVIAKYSGDDSVAAERAALAARNTADASAREAAAAKQTRLTPAQAARADAVATAAAAAAAYAAAGAAAVGEGRTSGGTAFAQATSPAVAAAAAAAAGLGQSLGVRSDGRMNVLMMVADDMRSQSMVYGKADTYTPSLARLAARGVVFDRAYAQVG